MAARMCGIVCGLLFVWSGTVWGADTARITQLAGKVHTDLHRMVKERKLKIADAVTQQKAFLLRQAEVKEVKQLRGNNLMVHFKDGNELLMLLGEDRLGSAETTTVAQTQQNILNQHPR